MIEVILLLSAVAVGVGMVMRMDVTPRVTAPIDPALRPLSTQPGLADGTPDPTRSQIVD